MKKLLLASCAAVSVSCLAPAAMAGDLGLAPARYDWSGGYVGVNAGAAINSSEFKSDYRYVGQDQIDPDTEALIDELDHRASASDTWFSAGILAGYNWQISGVVLGIEGDFNYLGMSATMNNDVSDVMSEIMTPETTYARDSISSDANWFGTVRARLGYSMGNFMLYGTAGLAYGEMDVKQELLAENGTESAAWSATTGGWNMGWTAGGGMEYAIDRWVVGAEYLYVDLGTYKWDSMANVRLQDPFLQADWRQVKESGEADLAFRVARATVKYRF